MTPHEAARSILRSKFDGYDQVDPNVVTWTKQSVVSLPSDVSACPDMVDALPATERERVQDFQQTMLRTDTEFWEVSDNFGDVILFTDRRLDVDHNAYVAMLKKMDQAGLLVWLIYCKETATWFYVKKKSGSLRMVVDARRSNRRFRRPPSTGFLQGGVHDR